MKLVGTSHNKEERGRTKHHYDKHHQLKLPRSEDPKALWRGRNSHSNNTTTNTTKKDGERSGSLERNLSLERRLSASNNSVKSTASTHSRSSSTTSSSNGGFRRLKKFTKSPSNSPSKASKSPSPTNTKSASTSSRQKQRGVQHPTSHSSSSPPTPTTKVEPTTATTTTSSSTNRQEQKEEDLSVSEKFQQAQLRLWKAALERNQKLQRVEEQKRLIKKKKQIMLVGEEGEQVKSTIISHRSSPVASTSIQEEDQPTATVMSNAEKKAKKLKKLELWKAANGIVEVEGGTPKREYPLNPTTPSSSMESTVSSATSEEGKKKKKKKRRLVKMGSSHKSNDNEEEVPRKKHKVKKEFEPSSAHTATTTTTTPDAFLPSSPSLSYGLADTVKTRVRSCNKSNKDKELELLQAASFEKKKRKKHRHGEDSETKKKDKAKKKKSVEYMVDEFGNKVPIKRKRGRPPKNKSSALVVATNETTAYDADAEVAPGVVVKKQGRPLKDKKAKKEKRMLPPSENSSTTTVPIKHVQKKVKKEDSASSHHHHPLPFKKRVAAAAAADDRLSLERSHDNHAAAACGATTTSKISISSGSGAAPRELEASSISDFTHPTVDHAYGSVMLNPGPSSVPPEIFSKTASTPMVSSFDLSMGNPANFIGPAISSSDSSDDSSDSDTDEEELYMWANKMFGTCAVPKKKEEKKLEPEEELKDLPPEMCEMERRRQQQEQARALTAKEVRAILKEEENCNDPMPTNWVRRSVRQPCRSLLNTPLVRKLLDKLRGNDSDTVVLKMKKYLSDPDTPPMAIDAALEALEECTICESLYIQVSYKKCICMNLDFDMYGILWTQLLAMLLQTKSVLELQQRDERQASASSSPYPSNADLQYLVFEYWRNLQRVR